MKEMEKVIMPLDLIDKEALKESQAAFVFGQMNEPQVLEQELLYLD